MSVLAETIHPIVSFKTPSGKQESTISVKKANSFFICSSTDISLSFF
jgi:hypothetical protein